MKLSAVLVLSSAASTSAFVASTVKSSTALRMSDENIPVLEAPVEPALPAMSKSMPFMARPTALGKFALLKGFPVYRRDGVLTHHSGLFSLLDGSLAGDVGFDPLGFAKSSSDLMKYREAEIKHARLAMLAAAGWPISELVDSKLANTLGLDPLVQSADRAPSILNGGLEKVSPIYWVACLAGAAAIDFYGIAKASKQPGYIPGDYGFDPLGLYPKDKEGQDWFQLAEIKNGRLAMIAITAFAVQEFVSKVGVIDETPIFFKPIGTTMHELTNSGYIQ